MHSSCTIPAFFFLTLCLLTTTIAQTPEPAQNLTGAITADPQVRCASGAASTRPTREDCIAALLHMPQDTSTHTFRPGSDPNEKYQLPKTFPSGRCAVTVSLRSGKPQDITSWIAINLAATQLILSCDTVATGMLRRTGGTVVTGRAGDIGVAINKFPRGANDAPDEDEQAEQAEQAEEARKTGLKTMNGMNGVNPVQGVASA
ncbi:MAG: hypothetical protein Q9164_003599 [Protoblastenia rupestris]